MTDIFDAKILCKNCNKEMKPIIVNKNGLELRAVSCNNCGDKIIHPADLNGMEHFNNIKDKKFNVKLRMVGNSHAISIPKEIINFMNERHRDLRTDMDDMVRLWFDDFDTLKLSFFDENEDDIGSPRDEIEESDDGTTRKRIRSDGKGNMDIVEEQNLSHANQSIKRLRIRKIRRTKYD